MTQALQSSLPLEAKKNNNKQQSIKERGFTRHPYSVLIPPTTILWRGMRGRGVQNALPKSFLHSLPQPHLTSFNYTAILRMYTSTVPAIQNKPTNKNFLPSHTSLQLSPNIRLLHTTRLWKVVMYLRSPLPFLVFSSLAFHLEGSNEEPKPHWVVSEKVRQGARTFILVRR